MQGMRGMQFLQSWYQGGEITKPGALQQIENDIISKSIFFHKQCWWVYFFGVAELPQNYLGGGVGGGGGASFDTHPIITNERGES